MAARARSGGRLAALLATGCLLGGAPVWARKAPAVPWWQKVKTRAQDRAIIAAAAAERRWKTDVPGDGYWTPTLGDLLALERALPEFLRGELGEASRYGPEAPGMDAVPLWKKAPLYKRQYVGVIRHGRKVVFANFFCNTEFVRDWRRNPIIVFDGGECFFRVSYDLATGFFGGLELNGDA